MSQAPTIDRLERVLAGRRAVEIEAPRQAAVCAVLRRDGPEQTAVLLIERTKRQDDPWSGQMAFPGGRVEETDPTPFDAALREAREEVGLDLARQARYLGCLDDTRAMAKGKHLDLAIRPFVFELEGLSDPPLTLQPDEVASTIWAPLEEMASGRLDGSFPWTLPGGGSANLPCYHVEGKVVWGLTWRMLGSLFDVLAEFDGGG